MSWSPDVLGEGMECRTLPAPAVGTGRPPPVATLVRYRPDSADLTRRPAVLHVHGYNDYFFQRHLAAHLHDAGCAVYAVDLRGCGRSWQPGEIPHHVTSLVAYADDLARAARAVRAAGHPALAVHAHSTGGLTASLWAHRARATGTVDALVLDSPWLDLAGGWFRRLAGPRLVDAAAPLDPTRVVDHRWSAYSWHLHVSHGGRWDYDLRLKPPEGFPLRAGMLRAVTRGQARVAAGLEISAPVLLAASAASGRNRPDEPRLDEVDTILDVERVVARAPLLGRDVTVLRVPGGIHDLTLSADGPRAAYLEAVVAWLRRRLG